MGPIEKMLVSKDVEQVAKALATIGVNTGVEGVHTNGRNEKSFKDEYLEMCIRRARELDASNK